MTQMRPLRTGETVHIERGRQRLEGTVIVASKNGRSLMLAFDGMIGGYIGMMPVLAAEEGAPYCDLIEGQEVIVRWVSSPDGSAQESAHP